MSNNKNGLILWLVWAMGATIGYLVSGSLIGAVFGFIVGVVIGILLPLKSSSSNKASLADGNYKKKMAEAIYSKEAFRKIADDYAASLDSEAKKMLPQLNSTFTSVNPQMQALMSKTLIEGQIEAIYQSARSDKRLKERSWETAAGFAQGAANLMGGTDSEEKKIFISTIAQLVLFDSYSIPLKNTQSLIDSAMAMNKK